ncbi:DNA methylase [uncultured Dysgonomonas sp.]|uniref:Methyltransferase n=1 Tax=uncultured Dysgonomonas sp. TaxID=206096 RepID=A0A212K4L4_9BACT|nr:site-specific DNA-methyltransferase [uncultured Dysgonomonas sp.]SBW06653.1 DNA methylase [uncultured Dysgonomonas sp.]
MKLNNIYYKTDIGNFLLGDSISLLGSELKEKLKGKVNLLITSPPFPLNLKKKYGNLQGDEYQEWFEKLAHLFEYLLADNGSLVIEIGNSWEPNRPVQSLLHLKSLLGFVEKSNLRLIQEFICYNPSRLPSPAQWVTVNRIRTVDSYTHVWWMAKSDYPKSDNSKVLRPYSKNMINLLKRQSFNSGKRPSSHKISEKGFLKDHGGSIAHNLLELDPLDSNREVRLPHNVLSFSNSNSNDFFMKKCREEKVAPHPARMHGGLVSFFVNFLTDENDLVLDPFAGSNTTGYVCEINKRKWLSIELNEEYASQSVFRFLDKKDNLNIKLK